MKKVILNNIFILGTVLTLSIQISFAASHTILINNNNFSPSSLTINFGDDVIFQLAGSPNAHPVMANNGEFLSFNLSTVGQQRTISGLSVGTHSYHCMNHGGVGSGMHGTITVSPVAGTSSSKILMYGLTISPNPFDQEVNLNLDQNHSDLSEIRITDIIGNEVAVVDLKSKVASYKLDLSYLKPGIYFFNLYSLKEIVETRKLIRAQ